MRERSEAFWLVNVEGRKQNVQSSDCALFEVSRWVGAVRSLLWTCSHAIIIPVRLNPPGGIAVWRDNNS